MKKFLSAAVLAVAVLLSSGAEAQTWAKALDAITTSTNSAFIPTGGANNLEVLAYSATTSTSSLPIKVCATAAAATCYTVTTVSNVSATPVYVNGPAAKYLYIPATVSAGAVTVYYSMNNGTRLPGWKTFDQYGVATSATGTIAVAAGKSAAISNSLTLAGTDSTTMTFPGTNATIARTDAAQTFTGIQTFSSPIAGNTAATVTAKATDGAITAACGTIYITKASALGSSTLATPTTPAQDGYTLRIVSTTAYAHAVSVASGKVNGGSNTTITFTSAAIGDSVTLQAIGGVWYVIGTTGTITIT
jgi:hypothetical protein